MPTALNATTFEELYSIHEKEYNIALMSVAPFEPQNIKTYLEKNFEQLPQMFKCIISKDNFDESIKQLDEIFYILDDNEEKMEFINYIKTLTSHYADISDAPDLGLSLEKVQGDMCKYFHCDMNSLRLVYNLIGPGTLWAYEENVRRENLGKGRNEEVIKNQNQIQQVSPQTITLLKGQAHPTAFNQAIVHASPPVSVTKEKRVLLRIESIF